jgi:hypothetical protein
MCIFVCDYWYSAVKYMLLWLQVSAIAMTPLTPLTKCVYLCLTIGIYSDVICMTIAGVCYRHDGELLPAGLGSDRSAQRGPCVGYTQWGMSGHVQDPRPLSPLSQVTRPTSTLSTVSGNKTHVHSPLSQVIVSMMCGCVGYTQWGMSGHVQDPRTLSPLSKILSDIQLSLAFTNIYSNRPSAHIWSNFLTFLSKYLIKSPVWRKSIQGL